MTDTEWQSCGDPKRMLLWLSSGGRLSERRSRLFAVACIRSTLGGAEGFARELGVVERYADGWATFAEMRAAFDYRDLEEGEGWAHLADPPPFPAEVAARIAREAAAATAGRATTYHAYAAGKRAAGAAQCRLLRDLVGDPFRCTGAFDPDWRTRLVLALALPAYEEQGADVLPVLADALEEAGCADAAVLTHLRSPGPHVRGCWAVDALLGKK